MKRLNKKAGERIKEYTYRAILHNILTLELPPGSAMSENELSAFLGVSRTPVRESLSELRHMGLVEVIPQIGSFVTKIDYEQIADAQFIRLSLENAAVRRICRQGMTESCRYRFHYNISRQKGCGEGAVSRRELTSLDNEFHQLLFEVIEKPQVYEAIYPQMVHFERLCNLSDQVLPNRMIQQKVEDHIRILSAMENGDEAAAIKRMTQHLNRYLEEKEELKACCPEYFTDNL